MHGDALGALKTAVGNARRKVTVCDYNGDAKVTASDALVILKVAVGAVIVAKCPAA